MSPSLAALEIYEKLTDAERIQLLSGNTWFWIGRKAIMEHGYNHIPYKMGAIKRLGIPGIKFVDGPAAT